MIAAAWALLAGAAALDYLAGPELGLLAFYAAAVGLASWFGGPWTVGGACVAATGLWVVGEILHGHRYSGPAFALFNSALRLGAFLALAAIVRLLRREVGRARRDPLTGVGNRRFFLELAGREIGRARRRGTPLSVAYVDLDGFKAVNDRFGHAAGDAVLRWVAAAVGAAVRTTDVFARIGGDEFALLMPDTGAAAAERVATKLGALAAPAAITGGEAATFSIGLVTFLGAPESVDALLRAADEVMYEAKRRGAGPVRSRVVAGAGARGEPSAPAGSPP